MALKHRTPFFLLFALSGFSGLIYESIWTHYLKLFLGHAAFAQTLVLAIFMGGMAVGSCLCSRYSTGWKNLLLGYAFTEGLIGICALLFHDLFVRVVEFSYVTVIPRLAAPTLITLFKWSLSALMILPQSVLLGMTFPLMSAGMLRLFPGNPGRSVALLYFTNSIGAAIGVLTSGFVLIGFAGLPGTIRIAGLINVALAAGIVILIRGTQEDVPPAEAVDEGTTGFGGKGWYRFFLAASLLTGAASFIYEIGWIRMLTLVMGSTTHAFEIILSVFIAGLALGGAWLQRRIDVLANPLRFLARVQVTMGILALSTLILYGHSFGVMQWLVKTLPKSDTGYMLFNLSSCAIATMIMLPATFCAGMTLPLITLLLLKEKCGERSIGAVYGANTVGAIFGVFFAIHLGMPLIGLKGLMAVGAGLDIALGIALAWSAAVRAGRRRPAAVLTVVGIGAVAATLIFVKLDIYKMGSGVYRSGNLLDRGIQEMLFHRDGKTATVSLVEDKVGAREIRTNGKTDALVMMDQQKTPSIDEPTMILLGAIPMALHPQAVTAASIGFGSGLTSHTLLRNSGMQEVDTVEIEPKMVEAARYFRPRNELVYTDPRSHVYIDDAKTFFSAYGKKYDIIVSEPSNPWVSGVAGLFSDEFYHLIKRHMNEGGLFVQWVQLYETNIDLVASVLKAVSDNFGDYAVYASNDVDIMIVARKNGQIGEPDPGILGMASLAADLKRIRIEGVQDIALRKVGDKKSLDRFVRSFPIRANSDYYPVLDLNAGRARFLGTMATQLLELPHLPFPTLQLLTGERPPWKKTEVTPSPYLQKSEAAAAAIALKDYFMSGNFSVRNRDLPEYTKQQAVRVKELFSTCSSFASQNDRLGSLFATSIVMIPYLTPAELAAVWKTLESHRTSPLSGPVRQSLALFEAISARDGAKMTATALALLESGTRFSPSTDKYIVAAGMTGFLMEGKKGEAFRLWSRYNHELFPNGEADQQFRLLAAESAG